VEWLFADSVKGRPVLALRGHSILRIVRFRQMVLLKKAANALKTRQHIFRRFSYRSDSYSKKITQARAVAWQGVTQAPSLADELSACRQFVSNQRRSTIPKRQIGRWSHITSRIFFFPV
jgi:hypothetical protein